MSFLFAAITLTCFLLSETIDLHRTETRRVSGRRRSGAWSGSWGRTLLNGERTGTKVPLLLRTELSLSIAVRERESSLGLSLILGSLLLRDLRTMVTSHAKQPIQEDFVSLNLFSSDLPIIVRGWRRVECLGTIGDVRVESFDEEEHERLFVKSSLVSD